MELIEPAAKFIESYKSALIEFDNREIRGFWTHFGSIDDAETYLRSIKRYRHVCGVEKSVVAASVYWLIDDDDFIGHVSVRHALNAALQRRGGHIGYAIRPSKQRQ